MSESNSIFQTGWTAVVLVGVVVVLFGAWLFLKVYRDHPSRRGDGEMVKVRTENGMEPGSEPEDTGNKSDEKQPDASEEAVDEKETEQANEAVTSPDTKTGSSSSDEKHADEPDQKTENNEETDKNQQKQSSEDTEKTTKETSSSDQKTQESTGQTQKRQQKTGSGESEGEGSEEKRVQVDQEQLNRAKELYSGKQYKKAIQKLDDILNELDDGKRADELRELKSSWTSEYKQRQKLADQWISKAETAAETNDWSAVIERANNALDHEPGNTRAEELIKQANEMKAYEGMVKISGGTYSYLDGKDGEKQVSAFYIDRFEVTNAEYKTFMEETGHEPPLGWDDRTVPVGREDHPVSGISYKDARAYASWAGKQLPTERQWEVVARGASGRAYPWGNAVTVDGSAPANTVEMGVGGSVSVDELPESCTPEDVCHLVGNVAEWTRTRQKTGTGEVLQVVKGGSYLYPIEQGKPSHRMLRAPDVRLKAIGFRCVKGPK
jgi:formylglycine-generating enzyme required for sulfatase activity